MAGRWEWNPVGTDAAYATIGVQPDGDYTLIAIGIPETKGRGDLGIWVSTGKGSSVRHEIRWNSNIYQLRADFGQATLSSVHQVGTVAADIQDGAGSGLSNAWLVAAIYDSATDTTDLRACKADGAGTILTPGVDNFDQTGSGAFRTDGTLFILGNNGAGGRTFDGPLFAGGLVHGKMRDADLQDLAAGDLDALGAYVVEVFAIGDVTGFLDQGPHAYTFTVAGPVWNGAGAAPTFASGTSSIDLGPMTAAATSSATATLTQRNLIAGEAAATSNAVWVLPNETVQIEGMVATAVALAELDPFHVSAVVQIGEMEAAAVASGRAFMRIPVHLTEATWELGDPRPRFTAAHPPRQRWNPKSRSPR